MSKTNEIQTYDGQKFELKGQSIQDYEKWRDEFLWRIGKDLARNFPNMYGNISFNIQGGRLMSCNQAISIIKKGGK